MLKGLAKDLRPLARKYQAKGWRLELTNKGHVRWIAPSGETVVSGSTPSDWRATKQIEARLKRVDRKSKA
jgi:hypothetical protein